MPGERGEALEGLLHQSRLHICARDTLPLSSVLYTESTPRVTFCSQLLTPCNSCSQGAQHIAPPHTHTQHTHIMSSLFSVRLTTLVSWLKVQMLTQKHWPSPGVAAERVHLASRGQQGGPRVGGRGHGIWKEVRPGPPQLSQGCTGVHLCCPTKQSELNEDFKKGLSLYNAQLKLAHCKPLSGACYGTLSSMKELSRSALRCLTGGVSGLSSCRSGYILCRAQENKCLSMSVVCLRVA